MRNKTFRHTAIAAALLIGLGGCGSNDSPTFEEPAAEFRPSTTLEAVLVSDAAAVRDFLAQGANVNATEVDGTTLLMRAIHGRSPEIAQMLIDAGASVSAANRYGVNALYLAARSTDAQTARALLAAGADANASLPEGETVLMTAAKTGSVEIVQALLAGTTGGTLFGDPSAELTATTISTSGYSAAAAASSELTNRADPNAKEGWHGQTALMWAAAEGHADVVRLLIEAGANVNEHSALIDAPEPNPERLQGGFVYPKIPKGRFTALHFAVREGQIETVHALIDGGADLNAVDEEGTNALILAALNGHFDIAGLLLEGGADPKIADSYGRTLLFVATDMNTIDANPRPAPQITSELKPVDIVKLALEKGADPNAALEKGLPSYLAQGGDHNPILNKGATAFLRAAMSGDLEIMNILLEAGADPLAATAERPSVVMGGIERPSNGKTTTLMAAAGVGWRESISRGRDADALVALELLLERGADINAVNQVGDTALHGATLRGSTAIIQFLVDHGADLNAKNAKGHAPLDIALGLPDERISPNEATATLLRQLLQVQGS